MHAPQVCMLQLMQVANLLNTCLPDVKCQAGRNVSLKVVFQNSVAFQNAASQLKQVACRHAHEEETVPRLGWSIPNHGALLASDKAVPKPLSKLIGKIIELNRLLKQLALLPIRKNNCCKLTKIKYAKPHH